MKYVSFEICKRNRFFEKIKVRCPLKDALRIDFQQKVKYDQIFTYNTLRYNKNLKKSTIYKISKTYNLHNNNNARKKKI